LDPEALGVRPEPRKGPFPANLSPPRVSRQGGRVTPFRNREDEAKKNVGSGILIFGLRPEKTGPEGWAGWGATKILKFEHFS